MFSHAQLQETARKLLAARPNDIVRLRLLRDVLDAPRDDRELQSIRARLHAQRWVGQLEREQQPDGAWGRFHSQDSKLKAIFPTSEIAIRRALALGLDKNDPLLARAARYMAEVLEGRRVWSDRVEKSEGWPVAVQAITAGTLAQVDPAHPSICPAWEYWAAIAQRCLPNGAYNPQAEWLAHRALGGLGLSYLHSRYVLTLLASNSASLPAALDRQIVDWIWHIPQGIGYLGADMQHPRPAHIFEWIESLEILLQFQSGREAAAEGLEWLWNQRNPHGLWDFGAKAGKSYYFPLSEDWRKAGNRSVDHSVRVLALVKNYMAA